MHPSINKHNSIDRTSYGTRDILTEEIQCNIINILIQTEKID